MACFNDREGTARKSGVCDKRFLLACLVGELRDSNHAGLKANVPQIRVYIAVPLQALTAAVCVCQGDLSCGAQ